MSAIALLAVLAAARVGPAETARPMPEAHGPVRFGEIRLSTGIRMHYAEQGDATGTPIVFLHGYSDSWFSFSRVLPLFPAQYRVFALDLRGQGDSDRPAAGYGMDEQSADVIAFMEAKGLTGVTVAGHSTGGYIAQHVAAAAPDRVDRLVLISTTSTPHSITAIRDLEAAAYGLGDPVPETFVRDFQMSTVHSPVPPDFMDRVVSESLKLTAHVWRGVMDGMLAMTEPAFRKENGVPALIIWGDRDELMPRAEQDVLLTLLPNATLRIYPETGHAPHWERPTEFARDLQTFMQSVRPDSSRYRE